jgi:methyl-accepting chemotaxis protein
MNNLKIGTRLAVAFSALLAVMLCVGWVCLKRMAEINRNLEMILQKRYAKIKLTNAAVAKVYDNGRITEELFLLKDRSQIDALVTQVEENKQVITADVASIEEGLDEKGARLITEVKDARKPYVESFTRAKQLYLAGKEGEAGSVVTNEMVPRLKTFFDAWQNFTSYQEQLMDNASKESQQTYESARSLVIVLIVLAVLLGVTTSFLVTRSITKPVTQALETARKVAQGDLRETPEIRGRDEIAA